VNEQKIIEVMEACLKDLQYSVTDCFIPVNICLTRVAELRDAKGAEPAAKPAKSCESCGGGVSITTGNIICNKAEREGFCAKGDCIDKGFFHWQPIPAPVATPKRYCETCEGKNHDYTIAYYFRDFCKLAHKQHFNAWADCVNKNHEHWQPKVAEPEVCECGHKKIDHFSDGSCMCFSDGDIKCTCRKFTPRKVAEQFNPEDLSIRELLEEQKELNAEFHKRLLKLEGK
jgi:hypothetical protein